MTTTTPDGIAIRAEQRRPSARLRFGIAFLVGIVLASVAGVGALYAYDQQYAGRVLPGVRLGALDLSGMDEPTAAQQIAATYASLGQGEVVVTDPDGQTTIPYAAFGRGPDVDAMVDEAMGIGRGGDPLARVVEDARTALHGAALQPKVTFDAEALAGLIVAAAAKLERAPVSASIAMNEDTAFVMTPGAAGRTSDPNQVVSDAVTQLSAIDAPAHIDLTLTSTPIEPDVSTVEAFNAKALAEHLTKAVSLTIDDKTQKIPQKTLRGWITFAPTAEGGYAPTIDTAGLEATIKKLAKKIDQKPVNASFRTRGSTITGVTKSQTGYKTDVAATTAKVEALLASRVAGAATQTIEPATKVTHPALTTAEAKAAWPKMRTISTWTTYFPLTIKNGFGTNIWLPTRLINGYVVAPHAEVRLLGRGRTGLPGSRLQAGRRDHRRPDTAARRARRWDLLVLDDPVQRRAPGRLPDGRPAEPLLLHRPLPAWPRRHGIQGRRLGPDDVVHQRHRLSAHHPRHQHPEWPERLRPVRHHQCPDPSPCLLQPADRQGCPAGHRHDATDAVTRRRDQ